MRKFLKYIKVISIEDNYQRQLQGLQPLGRGFRESKRINPYNPLSYLCLILVFTIGIILFGIIGVFNETDLKNPFKWS